VTNDERIFSLLFLSSVFFSAGPFLDCARKKGHKNGIFFLLALFWTAQKGRSIRMAVLFCWLTVGLLKRKEHRNGNFFAGSFWTAQNGRSIRMVVLCWIIFGLRKREGT
jgi:hypothetical protein